MRVVAYLPADRDTQRNLRRLQRLAQRQRLEIVDVATDPDTARRLVERLGVRLLAADPRHYADVFPIFIPRQPRRGAAAVWAAATASLGWALTTGRRHTAVAAATAVGVTIGAVALITLHSPGPVVPPGTAQPPPAVVQPVDPTSPPPGTQPPTPAPGPAPTPTADPPVPSTNDGGRGSERTPAPELAPEPALTPSPEPPPAPNPEPAPDPGTPGQEPLLCLNLKLPPLTTRVCI